MSLPRGWLSAAIFAGIFAAGQNLCHAQTPAQPQPDQGSTSAATAQPATPTAANTASPPAAPAEPAAEPVGLAATAAAKKIYSVPAGTKVLLVLRSAINTQSAKTGDGVYLSSTFPVVVGNRVMVPAGVYVQGVVDRVQRAGHVKGRSQLDMHFTSMIFPNGSVVEIPGMVNSLPGAKDQSVKNDGEGTVEQNPHKGRNAGQVAEVTIPTGATIGTIGGIAGGHGIAGGLGGVGAGLAAVGLVTLFTRGADVNIPSGTQVEMVLQRPLQLEEENLAGVSQPGAAPALVPAADQPKPITQHRPRIMCPPGTLGCE